VGAVIAEWLGGNSGLGVYMTRVRKSFSYDRMFAVIIVISALSLGLMKLVDLLQRVCMPWKRAEGNKR
jgi:ABC-type nitrate/sulfonate/bicarbonate transport system permease component